MSNKEWGGPEFLGYFCRHLVGLSLTFRHSGDKPDERDRFLIYSGTLIEVQGNTFFLTAGHVISEIKEALAHPKVEVVGARLADTFGSGRVTDHPIPIDLPSLPMFFVDDDAKGLDFGAIELSPYYVRLLAANGCVAVKEENWKYQSNVSFDLYVMLGFPAEFVSERVTHNGDGQVSPTLVTVNRLAAPPADGAPIKYSQFVGELDRRIEIGSVKGMSGGPILGFRVTEKETRYWVIALQSSWHPELRTVYACTLPTIAGLLTEWVARQRMTATPKCLRSHDAST